mgnify:CR=1 FL=1
MISQATAEAILTAIEELAKGEIGATRVLSAGDLALDAYDTIDDRTLAERTLVSPRIEVMLESIERNKAVAPRTALVQVDDVNLKLRIAVRTESEVRHEERMRSRARALSLADRLTKALTWPGNLAQTAGAVPTGLVSRCLHRVGPWKVTREDFKRKVLVIESSAKGRVQSTAPVS